MTVTWITPVGNLATLTERIIVQFPIEATTSISDGTVTYSLIAGNLPRGLRVVNINGQGYIAGSPTEVRKFTTSRFVIRADDGEDIEDRTFSISVDGSDEPRWTTAEGFLPAGENATFYVLDNSYVNFQLEAYDPDVIAGDNLEYFLIPRAGELPPGLSLSKTGVISGYTDPVFALEYFGITSGGYDTAPWDVIPLDFAQTKNNGFDSYFYDTVNYDFSESTRTPRRLSRIYTFGVRVSDGINSVDRLFKIYVVTEEFLLADNTLVQVDTTLFQAGSSGYRRPLWITESYLGRVRANNYVTLILDVYDPPSLEGFITYFLLDTNPGSYQLTSTGEVVLGRYELSGKIPQFKYNLRNYWNSAINYSVGDAVILQEGDTEDVWVCQKAHFNNIPSESSIYWNRDLSTELGRFTPANLSDWTILSKESTSTIPDGLVIDSVTGEIAGKVPYQTAVTKSYNFTVMAVSFPNSLSTANYTLEGDWNAYRPYVENEAVRYSGFIYICTRANSAVLPTNADYWRLGVSSAEKTFTVDIIGEIESSINWISDSDLGSIKPNQPSTISVKAESLIYGGRVAYEFVSGTLPPGLEFVGTGQIQGKVKQFADDSGPGLTRFYDRVDSLNPLEDSSTLSRSYNLTWDGGVTSFDKRFKFTVMARDSAYFAESNKTFFITVVADTTKTFANLYLKAFQAKSKRLMWYDFITDSNIFKPEEIYRYGDPNFGIQTDLKALIFAGIESVEAVKFVQAMSRNHYNKRLLFGDVKMAKAKDPNTQETIYEVIYVDLVDELEKNNKSISNTVNLKDNINSKVLISYDAIKVDSDIPFVSDSDVQRVFPNSIKNMRNRMWNLGDRDREFLPLWMRSIQDQASYELGYTRALTLCYAKPGSSTNIMARIKASNFDFKLINFEADRYIIDIIDNVIQDQYLAFPQNGIINRMQNPVEIYTSTGIAVSSIDNENVTLDVDSVTIDQE